MEEVTKGRDIKFYTIGLSEVPVVYEQLLSTGKDGSCAIFAFFPQLVNTEEHVEIQYCIENSKIGFEWVLIGYPKFRDQDNVKSHMDRLGYEYSLREMNGIEYLRVVNGDLVGLVESILKEMYGITEKHRMELVAGRFTVTGLNFSIHELYSPFYAQQ
jgi:hypothetical protein